MEKNTTFTDMLKYWHYHGFTSGEAVFDWLWVNGFIKIEKLKKFAIANR